MRNGNAGRSWFVTGLALAGILIGAGWLTLLTPFGVPMLLSGLGVGIAAAVSTRSLRLGGLTVAGLLLFVVGFPMLVNAGFWIGRGFSGLDDGGVTRPK